MHTRLIATVVAVTCLAGLQVPAFAQGAAAFPQTFNPADVQGPAPGWDYVAPAPQLYNQVPMRRPHAERNIHRRFDADQTSGNK